MAVTPARAPPNLSLRAATHALGNNAHLPLESAMKKFAYPLAILAVTCAAFDAQAGEREFKDIQKFAHENSQAAPLQFEIQMQTLGSAECGKRAQGGADAASAQGARRH